MNQEMNMKCIATLREQGFGAKAIKATYSDKTGAWALCRRFAVGSMRRVQLWLGRLLVRSPAAALSIGRYWDGWR